MLQEQLIAQFVKHFNQRQVYRWEESVQYQMHRIKEDMNRLAVMRDSVDRVYEAQKELHRQTQAFIRTESLNNKEVDKVFLNLKKGQFTRLHYMESLGTQCEHTKVKTLFDVHIEECKLAYQAKESTLVCIRKKAKDDLVAMFHVYLLFSEGGRYLLSRQLISHIFVEQYMLLIFKEVVLINEHMVFVALDTIRLVFGHSRT